MAKKHTIPCNVKSINDGKNVVSVGLSIERSDLDLDEIDGIFTGAQLDMRLLPAKDSPDQKMMFDEKLGVSFNAHCGGLSSVTKATVNLSLKVDGDDDDTVIGLRRCKFTKCRVVVTRVGDAAKKAGGKNEDEDKSAKLAG